MHEESSQLRHREREVAAARAEQGQRVASVQFASVEEALRVDRESTTLPSGLAARVSEAIKREPASAEPWWRRWFRKA